VRITKAMINQSLDSEAVVVIIADCPVVVVVMTVCVGIKNE
jgi:hypothetical protein